MSFVYQLRLNPFNIFLNKIFNVFCFYDISIVHGLRIYLSVVMKMEWFGMYYKSCHNLLSNM